MLGATILVFGSHPSCLSIVDSDDPEYLYAYIYVDGEHHWVLASQAETIFTSLATWEEMFEWKDCQFNKL